MSLFKALVKLIACLLVYGILLPWFMCTFYLILCTEIIAFPVEWEDIFNDFLNKWQGVHRTKHWAKKKKKLLSIWNAERVLKPMGSRRFMCPSVIPKSCCAVAYQPFSCPFLSLFSLLYWTLGKHKGGEQEVTFQLIGINPVQMSFGLFLRFGSSFSQTLSRPKQNWSYKDFIFSNFCWSPGSVV